MLTRPSLPRRLVLASFASAALILRPTGAAAQQEAFVDAAFDLVETLQGTFGDEGAAIAPTLDRMGSALVEWDRTIRALESRAAAEIAQASPHQAGDLHLTLARAYAARGRLAEARKELDAASRLEPRRADVLVLRGLVMAASSNPVEAGAAFRAASGIEPDDPVKAYYVVRYPHTPTDVERALQVLTRAYRRQLADTSKPTVLPFDRLSLSLQKNDTDTVILPLARYSRGYARLAAGDYDGALAELRNAAATDPLVTDPAAGSAPIMQAVGALRAGHLAEARARLADGTAPRASSEAHRVLGLIAWASADSDTSIEQLTLAVDTNPGDERSRLMLARVLSAVGRDTDAERVLLDTQHAVPDSALAHWSLGLLYERLNRPAEARREIESAAAGALAGRGSLYIAIGRLAGNAADVPAAIEAFRRAVDANPNDASAHTYLAIAMLQQDRPDEAFLEFVAALLIDPRDADAYAGIGQIHLDAARYDAAVEALRRAVDLSPDDKGPRYALATALMRVGRTQEATVELERVQNAQRRALAERRRTMSVAVLKEEAALRAAEGQYDRAIALYERAATLGRDPAVYRQLADMYAKTGRLDDAARARAMAERVAP